ncbi:E3 binding domain-containing protein [Ammoniphilus resinae]
MARDHRLDLQETSVTGPNGRIQRMDIEDLFAKQSGNQ